MPTEHSLEKKYYLITGLVLVSLVALMIVLFSLPEAQAMNIVDEGGYIETLSVVGYFTGGVIALYLSSKKILTDNYIIGFLLFVLGCRELDFHKAFTDVSVSSTRFYVSPDISALEKLIATPIVISIVIIIFYFLKRYALSFTKDLFNRSPYAIIVAPALVLFIIGKIADSSLSFLRDINFTITPFIEKSAFITEECLELGLPCFFLLGLFYMFERSKAFK